MHICTYERLFVALLRPDNRPSATARSAVLVGVGWTAENVHMHLEGVGVAMLRVPNVHRLSEF